MRPSERPCARGNSLHAVLRIGRLDVICVVLLRFVRRVLLGSGLGMLVLVGARALGHCSTGLGAEMEKGRACAAQSVLDDVVVSLRNIVAIAIV
jgi:hypothetical protein